MKEIGSQVHNESTSWPRETVDWKAFYEKVDTLTAVTREELPNYLDLPYSNNLIDPKQRLDVYLPKRRSTGCPVFVFLHGGGFREGDRAHYGFVAVPFAKHGILTVVPSYRLTPRYHYPEQPENVRYALAWVFHHIECYGGDPECIYICGHSAGGTLAAFISLKTDWLKRFSLPDDLIKGCTLISAPYDLTAPGDIVETELFEAYVPDPMLQEEACPSFNIETIPPEVLVAVGRLEDEHLTCGPKAAREFVKSLKEKDGCVELMVLEGMNHADTVLALGNEESKLFKAILRMINRSLSSKGFLSKHHGNTRKQ